MALTQLTKVDGRGINTTSDYRVGILTAVKFVGPFDGTGGNFAGVVTATDGNFSGNVTIGGTLTYEDVTNIDSVGIITARDGIHVGAGVSAVGVGTFGSLDISGDIDVDGHTNLDNVSITGVTTLSHTGANQLVIKDSDTTGDDARMRISFRDAGDTEKFFVGNNNSNGWLYLGSPSGQNNNIAFRVNGNDKFQVNGSGAYVNGALTVAGNADIADSIIHTGDTNTKIRFPSSDTITAETAGTERLRINSAGEVIVGSDRNDTYTQKLFVRGSWVNATGEFAALYFKQGDTSGGSSASIRSARLGDNYGTNLRFYTQASGLGSGGDGTLRLILNRYGHLIPGADSTYDIGDNSVRFRNLYADTLYGDGSNLTGIAADKIFEGNTKAEVIDTGSNGHFLVETEGTERLKVNGDGIDVSGEIELDNGGSAGVNFKRNGTLKADIEIGSANDELAIRARGSSGFILLSTGSSATPRLRIDSVGNLVTGNQTSPTSSDTGNIYIKNGSTIGSVSHQLNYATNAVFDSSWKYITSGVGATRIVVNQNGYKFDTATSGTAGNAITFAERFNINADGKVVKQQFTATNTYAANDTTQCGYQSQNLSDATNTYSALRLTAGNSSPATAQLSSIRTGAGQNDFTIQLETGNTAFEALRIKSNGYLGLGINNPARHFHLHVGSSTANYQLFTNSTTGSNNNDGLLLGITAAEEALFWNYENTPSRFATGGSERMAITSTGQVNIGGDYTQTTYTMKVTGSFAATTKSFVIDHPTKEKLKLRYACLEGPENSVYVRGKTSDSVIELPDYWTGLVHEDSITVNVTPIGNHKVWVESINNNSVTIGSDGSEYFYTVFAERKDVDKLEVEVEE